MTRGVSRVNVREMVIFAMLGAIMFCSKVMMEALPNIHLVGMLTIAYTIVLRTKALIPLYIYVMLSGLFAGFSTWWIPYLYVWTILWGVTMLLPRRMPRWLKCVLYPAICLLHGLFFGALYAPVQAIVFGLNFEQTIAWIVAGLGFDVLHAVGNLFAGLLALPVSELLARLMRSGGTHHAPRDSENITNQ